MYLPAILTMALGLATNVLAAPSPAPDDVSLGAGTRRYTMVDLPGPNNWIASNGLFQKLIDKFQGTPGEFNYATWTGHVIKKCNEEPKCTSVSVYSMAKGPREDLTWYGEIYEGGQTRPEDYTRQDGVLHSQVWSLTTPLQGNP